MITEETVLILGAGASVDYDYPLGPKLIMNICNELSLDSALYRLLLECEFQSHEITRFSTSLYESNRLSIDAFLESRSEFEKIGKAAIAGTLIPCERKQNLSRKGWYEYLHSLIIGRKEEFLNNKLSVVTFNYDRSFEAALLLALQNSYNLTDSKAVEYVKSIPVIHVYGQLGALPMFSENARPYGAELSPEILMQSTAGIKIVHEGEDNTPELQLAREKIEKAKVVCCLGFGYHPENVKRLRLGDTLQGNGREVHLSTYGFTTSQVQKLEKRLFPAGYTSMVRFQIGDHPVRAFLKYSAALE